LDTSFRIYLPYERKGKSGFVFPLLTAISAHLIPALYSFPEILIFYTLSLTNTSIFYRYFAPSKASPSWVRGKKN
jgi:hypothetical protein